MYTDLVSRIELDDVERTISDIMPEITAVSVQPDESQQSLCAFVTPKSIDGSLLRTVLSKRLPSYMVPTAVYSLDRLPLNTNDKVDHKTIRTTMSVLIAKTSQSVPERFPFMVSTPSDLNPSTSYSSTLPSYPGSPSEVQMISHIWKDVLNLSQLPSPSDNFFDLGGNR
jgi:AMP-binding enzyme C-terminal domain